MKVCLVHNAYGRFSGEEEVVDRQADLLRAAGHEVLRFERSSAEIPEMFLGRARAFFAGIYNPLARRRFAAFLTEKRPEIVHIHNLFPLISPSILDVCRERRLAVVMTVHNYRLICPSGLFLSRGEVCERCRGGREYWCVWRRCEGSLLKSLGYALRGAVARRRGSFRSGVQCFAVLTEFQRKKMVDEGFDPERIEVIPNMARPWSRDDRYSLTGDYIGYVGRISPEKGIDVILQAARLLPELSFRLAGDPGKGAETADSFPKNVFFQGYLDRVALDDFFMKSRMILLPSRWYEGFPMVALDAMLYGKPLVASRIGGIPEIVDDGETGLLFAPGDVEGLAEKIRFLWDRPDLCLRMGTAGREKALREYSPQKYYDRLMTVYEHARNRVAD